LQTTLDPREIAWLAQSLEQQAPGQYGEMAAQAARDALTAAGTGQLEDRDVGVLFGVLQKYGGDDAATDLENFSSQYVYYAVIALANLPDGAGVSSLLDMLRDSEMPGGHAPVLQMLAQAALDSPKALEALKEQARMNQIPTSSWLNIASMLMGDKVEIGSAPADSGPGVRSFHLAISNQNFYTIPDRSQWPPEQVNRYIDVVNQLAAANKNPMAAAALQNALTALQARLQ
jgi:hypothetical protein